jgi:hypothetical protein
VQQGAQFGRGATLAEQQRLDQVNQARVNRNLQAGQFGEQLAQQGTQFEATLAEQAAGRLQQGEQFTSQLGETTAGRLQQGEQFTSQLGETTAGRLQQGGQFDRQLAQQQGTIDFSNVRDRANIALSIKEMGKKSGLQLDHAQINMLMNDMLGLEQRGLGTIAPAGRLILGYTAAGQAIYAE